MTDTPNRTPYGPNSALIRRFFARLAALDGPAHDAIVASYLALAQSSEFELADRALRDVIGRSGREDARDALFGPFLQMMRVHGSDELDAIAESALAVLMSLLVIELLPERVATSLYAPYESQIPMHELRLD